MGFQFREYDYGGSNIGQLMMAPAQAQARAIREGGMARARAAEIGGQATSQTIGTIGNLISGAFQGYAQHQADAPRREAEAMQIQDAKDQRAAAKAEAEREARREAAFTDLLSRGDVDPKEILTIYGPERGSKIAQGLDAFAKIESGQVQDARTEAGRLAAGFLSLSPTLRQQLAPQIRAAAIKGGLGTEETIPQDLPDDFLRGVISWSKGEAPKAPEPFTLSPGQTRFNPDGTPVAEVKPEVKPPTIGSFEDYVTRYAAKKGVALEALSPADIEDARKRYQQADDRPRVTVVNAGGGGDMQGGAGATQPIKPDSQDIMGHAGLSYNGFLALTNPTRLPRDQATRNKAAQEVQRWARDRGMDVATFQSQFKAFNDVLEKNIERFNTVKNIEGELVGSVENLIKAANDAGLNDARAINAAKLWLKGELNDAQAADYGFSLRALISDIARYNAASSGRAPLESDMSDARAVVRSGIASGSLRGLQAAINRSVKNMGSVLEGSVNRANQNVWNLFGVGDKYKPKTTSGAPPPAGGRTGGAGGMGLTYDDYLKSRRGGG